MVRGDPPVFDRLNTLAVPPLPTVWAGNESALGESTATAGGAAPVPVSVAATDPPVVATVIVAERAPTEIGLNTTLIVHVAPAASVAPQVCVCVKLVGLVPDNVYELIINANPPVFERVNTLELLVVLMVCEPNAAVVGVSTALAGNAPVPSRWIIFFPVIVSSRIV